MFPRSGDVVMMFKNKTGGDPNDRYISAGNIPGWHGSLNRSDSYVPLIVSYPGGNAPELVPLVTEGCSGSDCTSNRQVPAIVKSILGRQIP